MSELYKYRKFDSHALECVSENVIWVSKPQDFNDPFEYSFRIDPDMPIAEVIKRKKDATHENYMEKQLELIEKIMGNFLIGGIFSVSETKINSLMWSHYADSHKGFCIGYGKKSDNQLSEKTCHKVSYGKYSSFGLMELWKGFEQDNQDIKKKVFKAMVLAKDPNWQYEREWRVLYGQSNQLIQPDFKITSITFGIRMPDYQKKLLIKLLKDRNVSFYSAQQKKDSYDLKCTPYIT